MHSVSFMPNETVQVRKKISFASTSPRLAYLRKDLLRRKIFNEPKFANGQLWNAFKSTLCYV